MTNQEMLRALKAANTVTQKIQNVQSTSNPEPPSVAPPNPPYVETAQFEEKLNQIQASLQNIDSKLESEKQARILSEVDNKKQKVVDNRRSLRNTALTVISIIFSAIAAVAAVLALLPAFR